jgi:hypothetical protein
MTFDTWHFANHLRVGVTAIHIVIGFLWVSPVSANHDVFALHLNSAAFTQRMCKKITVQQDIRILASHHRDLLLKRIPNQFIPKDSEEARKKSYVYAISLQDLTDGMVNEGIVAFDQQHAVIFRSDASEGISRRQYISDLPRSLQSIADQGLNTFLHLHPILNSAINACRPYPSKALYGTDDEFDKIEKERIQYRNLVKKYNAGPDPPEDLIKPEKGKALGFVDPTYRGKFISYQAMNPLNFFRKNSSY